MQLQQIGVMANNGESIISIEHLSKSFDGAVVLDDINIEIKKGEFVTPWDPRDAE